MSIWSVLNPNDFPNQHQILQGITDGAFVLKAGQSLSDTTDFVTINTATTKLDIATPTGLSTTFMHKNDFVAIAPSVTYYAFCTSCYEDYTSSHSVGFTCSLTMVTKSYYTTNSSGLVDVGDIVYVLVDGGYYPLMVSDGNHEIGYMEGSNRVLIITDDSNGSISFKGLCSALSVDSPISAINTGATGGLYTTFSLYFDRNPNTGFSFMVFATGDISGYTSKVRVYTADIVSAGYSGTTDTAGPGSGYISGDVISIYITPFDDGDYIYHT